MDVALKPVIMTIQRNRLHLLQYCEQLVCYHLTKKAAVDLLLISLAYIVFNESEF